MSLARVQPSLKFNASENVLALKHLFSQAAWLFSNIDKNGDGAVDLANSLDLFICFPSEFFAREAFTEPKKIAVDILSCF